MTLTEQEYECLVRNAMRRLDNLNRPNPDIERAQAWQAEAIENGFGVGDMPDNDVKVK